jgi:hypothetical protein
MNILCYVKNCVKEKEKLITSFLFSKHHIFYIMDKLKLFLSLNVEFLCTESYYH